MASDPQSSSSRLEALQSETFGADELPLDHFRGMNAEEIESHFGIGPKTREQIQGKLEELAHLEREAGVAPAAPTGDAPAPTEDQTADAAEAEAGLAAEPEDAGQASQTAREEPLVTEEERTSGAEGDLHAAAASPEPGTPEAEQAHPEQIEGPGERVPEAGAEGAPEHGTPAHEPDGHGHGDDDGDAEPFAPHTGGALTLVVVMVLLVAIIVAMFLVFGSREDREARERLEQLEQQTERMSITLDTVSTGALDAAEQQALAVAAKANEGNLGEALEHLATVRATLTTLETAAGEGAEAQQRERVAAALQAANQAEAALRLEQPTTQTQVNAATKQLWEAVVAIRGDEEVKG